MARCIPTGSTLLDLALGGGWIIGEGIQLYGKEGSGKSQLALEAMTNLFMNWRTPQGFYLDAEGRFNTEYAQILHTPVNKIDFMEDCCGYTERFIKRVESVLKEQMALDPGKRCPILNVVDSLDMMTTEKEKGDDADDGYHLLKHRLIGEYFRRNVDAFREAQYTPMFISQIRDKVEKTGGYGPKEYVTGGATLRFLSSQRVKLTQLDKIDRTIDGITRTVGTKIKAYVAKNSITAPFKEVDLSIKFNYGIEDWQSCLVYLKKHKYLHLVPGGSDFQPESKQLINFERQIDAITDSLEFSSIVSKIQKATTEAWHEIEEKFKVTRTKYPEPENYIEEEDEPQPTTKGKKK